MDLLEPLNLWKDIVAATSDLGSNATALRIPLYVMLQEPRPSAPKQAKDILIAASVFFHLSQTKLPRAIRGGLVFCFAHPSPANLNNLLPVAREAQRRGLLSGIVLNQNCLAASSEFVGQVPSISVQELLGRLDPKERLRNIRSTVRAFSQLFCALSKRRPDLISSLIENRSAILRAMTSSVQFGSAFERVLDVWSPSCVVSTSDFWPLEHQLFCNARERHIPSVVIQHGTVSHFWWPFVADHYYLWGDAYVNEMRQFGTPPERLTVAGMPATDEMFRRAKSLQHEQISEARQPVCLILSHAHGRFFAPEAFKNYDSFLTEIINSTPYITWKVKLHPAEDDAFYRALNRSIFERLVFHPKETSLWEAVADADITTTLYSTSGLEAMIMDRPLIVAPLSPQVREYAPWPATGGGTYAASATEFLDQLSRLIDDQGHKLKQIERQHCFLHSHFANPGRSTRYIVDLLEQYPLDYSARVARKQGSEAAILDR
jgi:hypothetical protein